MLFTMIQTVTLAKASVQVAYIDEQSRDRLVATLIAVLGGTVRFGKPEVFDSCSADMIASKGGAVLVL